MKSLIKCLIIITAVIASSSRTASGQQTAETFEGQVEFQYKYLLHLPNGYESDTENAYPFILFLHGMGERGENLDLVKVHGPPKVLDNKKDFPFIVVSPQCPDGEWWQAYKLNALMEDLVKKYRIDKNRIYLTGLSMGGFGTWDFASRYPHWFAAIAPICGGGDALRIRRLKDMPIWAFHGMKDQVVPIERTLELVRALEKVDGDITFTVYPEAGHDSWTETYNNPALWDWFLEHKRQDSD
jgi:predicted peptidase